MENNSRLSSKSPMFTVIANEVTDISNKEQLSIVVKEMLLLSLFRANHKCAIYTR